MTINTCSEAISFARQLEKDSSKFYECLSNKYKNHKELFLSFIKDNEDYITQIERAYYGVITDAIEGCFAFNLNPEEFKFDPNLQESKEDCLNLIKKALEMEERILKFYREAAEQSKSLMADVPRAFKLVAKKRESRLSKLKSLINSYPDPSST